MEIELKYLIDNVDKIDRIFNDPMVDRYVNKEFNDRFPIHAVYFDTVKDSFQQSGIIFRVRREGGRIVATLKWDGMTTEGLHKREEINVPVDEEIMRKPNISIFRESPIYEELEKMSGGGELLPVMEMNFIRNQVRIDTGKSISLLSVDRGDITCKGFKKSICELEIELYSGDYQDMVSLGSAVAAKYKLAPGEKSKFQQGLELKNR